MARGRGVWPRPGHRGARAPAVHQPRDRRRRRPRFDRGRRCRRRRHRPHRSARRPADGHGPRRPLQHRAAVGRRNHADRPGRRLRRERASSDRHGGGARHRGRAHAGDAARRSDGHPDAHRAAPRRHSGQRQRVDAQEIRQSPAVVADDVLRQVPTFSLFRRTSSLVAQPTTQGVSLRGIGPSGVRAARSCCSTACRSTIRSAAGSTGPACRSERRRIEITEDTASSLYGNYAMGGVINILTSRPTRRTIELKPQYGNLQQPEVRLLRQRSRGASWAPRSKAASSTPTASRSSRRRSADRSTTTPTSNTRNVTAKVEYDPTSQRARLLPRRPLQRGPEQRQDTRSTDEERTTPAGRPSAAASASQLPDQSNLQARICSSTTRHSHFNFLAVSPTRRRPAHVGAADDRSARADQRRRRHGAVDEGAWPASTSSPPAPTGAGSMATARRMLRRRCRPRSRRDAGGDSDGAADSPAAPSRASARSSRTSSRRCRSWSHAQRARRSLAELRRPQLETTVATGLPTANNLRDIACPDVLRPTTPWSARASRRCIT